MQRLLHVILLVAALCVSSAFFVAPTPRTTARSATTITMLNFMNKGGAGKVANKQGKAFEITVKQQYYKDAQIKVGFPWSIWGEGDAYVEGLDGCMDKW